MVDPADGRPVDPNAIKCTACGRYHGGVTAGVNCLRGEVLRLRALVRLYIGAHHATPSPRKKKP